MIRRIETHDTMAHTPAPARRAGRRSPLATTALLVVGLLATGGAYALATTTATTLGLLIVGALSELESEVLVTRSL